MICACVCCAQLQFYAELSEREGGRPVFSKIGGGHVRVYFARYCSQWKIDARRPKAASDLGCYFHDDRSMKRPPTRGWLRPNTREANPSLAVEWLEEETQSAGAERQSSRPF
jgi:hypothetical protein